MPITGSYSKGIDGGFDEELRLQMGLVRPGINWIDADENMKEYIRYYWIRRALETVLGTATSPNDGFRCIGTGALNDFTIKGGDGTLDGAGRIWVAGIHCFLTDDIPFLTPGSTPDELSILPQISYITGVTNQTIEDAAASYVPGSLVGRVIVPDIAAPGVVATILANTATTILCSIDLVGAGVSPGARYRINTFTPIGSGRIDGVYLNVHMTEVDGTEVPEIQHNLGTLITAQYFNQVRPVIELHQDDTPGLPGALSTEYTDVDGFKHYRVKIAEIVRYDGQDAINALDVTDLRITTANFSTFLKKNGDTMTGDLNLSGANIVPLGAETVDGRDVSVDGAKLDTITWSGQGIADLLPKVSKPVQGLDQAGVTTQQISVGQTLRTKTPGATETTKGVFTTLPYNKVLIKQTGTDDDYTVGPAATGGAQNVLFGRLTEAHPYPLLSGTWTWTNASNTVVGASGAASTELLASDLVQAPNGEWYTVASTPTLPNQFTIIEPYTGGIPSPDVGANPAARRWLLDLRYNNQGTEQDATPGSDGLPASLDITWYYHENFDYASVPPINPLFSIDSDQAAAEVPLATETAPGKVQLAPSGNTDAGKAVQGSDVRLTGIFGKLGLTTYGRSSTVELEAGNGIGLEITDLGSTVRFTITNSDPGSGAASPPTPGAATDPDAGATPASGGAGSGGGAATYARSDHYHGASQFYAGKTHIEFASAAGDVDTGALGFTPRIAIFMGVNAGCSLGLAIGDGASDQGNMGWSGTAFLGGITTGKLMTVGGNDWVIQSGDFTSGGVKASRIGAGANTIDAILLVLGDLLD